MNSHEVICSGIGLSDAIAKFAASLFNRKGKNVPCIVETSVAVLGGCMIKMTVLFFFTVSGETREIIDRIKDLKKYDIKIIVITNSASSTFAKMSDLALTYYMPSTKNGDFYSSATQSCSLYH